MADAATWTLESGLSPYRVVCTAEDGELGCGVQHLSDEQYAEQLAHPDRRWRCPWCGEDATWDDAWHAGYEEAMANNGFPDSDEDGGGFVGRELVHLVEGGKLLCRGRLEQYEQMVELSRFRAGGSAAPNILITCAGCLQGLAGLASGGVHLDVSGDPACGVGLEPSGGLGADTPLVLPTGHRLARGLEPVTCSRCLTFQGATVYPVGVQQADWRLLGAWKRWLRRVEASGGVDAYVAESMAAGVKRLTLVEGGLASPESVRGAVQTLLGQLPADADLTAYNTVAAFVGAMLGADPMCECGARKGSHMVDHRARGVVFKCTLREGVFTTAVEA